MDIKLFNITFLLKLMLVKNQLLEEIAEEFSTMEPEWEKIAELFWVDNKISFIKRNRDTGGFRGLIGEYHLRNSLRHIVDKNNLGSRINLYPLREKSQTEEFSFNYTPDGGIVVNSNEDKRSLVEYDDLFLIDSVPIVSEIKLLRTESNLHEGKCVAENHIGRINRLLGNERIKEIKKPLIELFDKQNIRYWVILHPEAYNRFKRYYGFFDKGGVLSPFYCDNDQWKEEVRKFREKYNL